MKNKKKYRFVTERPSNFPDEDDHLMDYLLGMEISKETYDYIKNTEISFAVNIKGFPNTPNWSFIPSNVEEVKIK